MQQTAPLSTAKIEITQPRVFKTRAVLTVCAYGFCLSAPILFAMLLVSVVKFGILTVLIPLLAVACTVFFLPFGFGNPYVTRLVQSFKPAPSNDGEGFVVQLRLSPRLRSGVRALLEDADDVGYLSFNRSHLRFDGDSVKLSAPFDCIQQVRPKNIGFRGLFLYGRRIRVVVSGLPNVRCLEFAERSSWLLPTSRRVTKQLCQHLSKQ